MVIVIAGMMMMEGGKERYRSDGERELRGVKRLK